MPSLHGAIVNGSGSDGDDEPGAVTDSVVEVAHGVCAPVGTSEYWNVNSACCVAVNVTRAGGCVGGPDRLIVRPSTTVVGNAAPAALNLASVGYPFMVHAEVPTAASVTVPTIVPAAPWVWPGVTLTRAQAATPDAPVVPVLDVLEVLVLPVVGTALVGGEVVVVALCGRVVPVVVCVAGLDEHAAPITPAQTSAAATRRARLNRRSPRGVPIRETDGTRPPILREPLRRSPRRFRERG